MTKHTIKTIASGEYSCSCGAVWDRDEGSECPANKDLPGMWEPSDLSGGETDQPNPLTVLPAELFDGFAVYSAMTEPAKQRTSGENVSDALNAVVKLIRARLRVMPTCVPLKEAEPKDAPYISDDVPPDEAWAAGWNAYREAQAALSAPSHGEQVREVPKQLAAVKVSLRMLESGRGVAKLEAWDLSQLKPGMNSLYAAAPSAGSQEQG